MTPIRQSVDRSNLGLNPLAIALVASQALCLALTAPLYPMLGLSFDWKTAPPLILVDAGVFLTWLYLFRAPGKPREWIVAETLFAFLLMLTLSHILAPAQYAAVALKRPLIDPLLAGADAILGVHVPDLAEWVRAHRIVAKTLTFAYFTLLAQFVLITPALGFVARDRAALWEFMFHFHLCAIVTVVGLAVVPAACAFQYYGFESVIDQARFIRHFNGFRAGSLTVIRFNDLEGLISMPSFHVAGALMVTWALRRHRVMLVPVAIANTGLVAATFLTGAHYFVDVLATLLLLAASVAAYGSWGERYWRIAAGSAAMSGDSPEKTLSSDDDRQRRFCSRGSG
jgi:hypothetical protein